MTTNGKRQFCAVCAWRANCAKKFSVADGGAHCPDFTRDVSITDPPGKDDAAAEQNSEGKGA